MCHFLVMADDMTRNLTIARLLMSLDDQHMAMVIGLVAFYQDPSQTPHTKRGMSASHFLQ